MANPKTLKELLGLTRAVAKSAVAKTGDLAQSGMKLKKALAQRRKASGSPFFDPLPRPKSLAASLGLDEAALKKSGLLLPTADDKVRLFRVQASGGNELTGIGPHQAHAMGRWFHEDPRLADYYSNRFRPDEYADLAGFETDSARSVFRIPETTPHELTFTDFARGPHEQYRVSNMQRPRPQKPPYTLQDNPREYSMMPEDEFFLPRGGFSLGGQFGLESISLDKTKALLDHLSKQQGVRIKRSFFRSR